MNQKGIDALKIAVIRVKHSLQELENEISKQEGRLANEEFRKTASELETYHATNVLVAQALLRDEEERKRKLKARRARKNGKRTR